jgi:translation initiation factor 1
MPEICRTCGQPKDICTCEVLVREQHPLTVTTDKRRYGKMVTIVECPTGDMINLDSLAKTLKTLCAAGGTAKRGRIELQGDHKKRVKDELEKMGFTVEVK